MGNGNIKCLLKGTPVTDFNFEPIQKQKCIKCLWIKPISEFRKRTYAATGYGNVCKKCDNAQCKSRTQKLSPEEKQKKKEKAKENHRRYREKVKNSVRPNLTGQKQTCYICKQEKDYSQFSRSRHIPSGYKRDCKECYNIFRKEQYHRLRWGISLSELEAMKKQQQYKCECCKNVTDLEIDHNHNTGIIRGLLCGRCNRALGCINDSEERCFQLQAYLRKYAGTNDPNSSGKRILTQSFQPKPDAPY